ncbi:MAG: hypothetical protein RTV72_09100 [Candidatus Thorarchaeota archaeon]
MIGSCGKKKSIKSVKSPTCNELDSSDDLHRWRKKQSRNSIAARDLYIGNQNRELAKGVDLLRRIKNVEVRYSIISAGFGLVDEHELLPSYDCSFTGMKKSQIQERAQWLNISLDFQKMLETGFDLVYLALGKMYSLTLTEDWRDKTETLILGFNHILPEARILSIPSAHEIVKAFSHNGHKIHGITGFKGDLLRILANYALEQKNPYREILGWSHPVYVRDLIMKLGNLETLN